MKDDPWGNKIPVMSISGKECADIFLDKHKDTITQVIKAPISKSTIILM